MFARLNTYSIGLNRQELRNGRYFGQFKTTVYETSYRHIEFWRRYRILSEGAIARMSEAELTSELFVLILDGLQDKKTSLDEFYGNLDDYWGTDPRFWRAKRDSRRPAIWLDREETVRRFDTTLSAIAESVGELIPRSSFRRPALFYSLFSVVYHRLYGVNAVTELDSPQRPLTAKSKRRLWEAVEEVSQLLTEKPSPESVPSRDRDLLIASASQTDNLLPRQVRLEQLWNRANLSAE
ncbi:hypothetical protein AB1046_23740 [Promicromonospora sp. Populi]|uniref:hypothetical protein n=1 Tax=Promicromonospora sp. Populi TaxID=3239420 RepID=UPI0034E24DD1